MPLRRKSVPLKRWVSSHNSPLPHSESLAFISASPETSHSLSEERTEVSFLDDGLEKMGSIEIVGYCSAIRKDEILPFATTWMDLENIMLSEISQSEKVRSI